MKPHLRPFAAAIGAMAMSAVVVFGVLDLLLPAQTTPSLAREPAVAPALTRHLMLVIVDGLRYDVATDPARMPQFSRAMREEASGELWAGRVSMTTSAVLTIATGERATFEQIVFNAFPRPPPYDSWLAEAAHAGKSLLLVGDPAWSKMFGPHFREQRLDPEGVAIDVDFNPETFRHARELRDKKPTILIVHFTTPDHQAHAYTVPSQRYADHMRGFDRDLFAFLGEFDPDWTILVAGDHGASDSGTHGTDVDIQRRTVVWGRGPGIARGAHSPPKVDQADLAGTISALLGVPAPAHSRGQILTDWLDTSSDSRLRVACANAKRALELADLAFDGSCSLTEIPRQVKLADERLESRGGLAGGGARRLTLLATLIALFTAFFALDLETSRKLRGIAGAALVGAFGVFLTWGVERLPGSTPFSARLALFIAGNLPALVLLLAPGRAARFAERFPIAALVVVPGFLLATYTTNAQPEAFVAVALGLGLLVGLGGVDAARPTLRAFRSSLPPLELGALAVSLFVLFFPGTRTSDIYPNWLRRDPTIALAVALAALAVTIVLVTAFDPRKRVWAIGIAGAIAVPLALLARRAVGPFPGRLAILVGLAATIGFAFRGKRVAALVAGLFSYAWISRDIEILPLAATILVADGAGRALSRHLGAERMLGFPTLLVVTAFLFGIAFVQRIGIQTALDFGAMDWGAAGFGDRHVSAWVVGIALGMKYVLALGLAVGAFVSWLPRESVLAVLRALFLAFVARGAVLAAMLLLVGESYWTGLRVLGDLPFALLWSIGTALIWAALHSVAPRSSSS